MVSDPDTHAYRQCAWCHCMKPQRETVTWNGSYVCADGDCLLSIRSARNVSYFRLDEPSGNSGDGK